MAKSFLVSPGRAYLVIAEEGTKIVRANGTLIDTVPEGANSVSITVDSHEIIVMDNAAKIQQLYNGNSGSNGILTTADGEDAGTWKIEIVSSLPEQGSAGIIYMLRTNRTGTDRYDDYIWIPEDNAYELLGRRPESTPVDLSNVAKTNVENTFTKSQQINGTLTATDVNVANLSCDQEADIGTATVNDLDYNTASGSSMTVSHVTILTSLHVAPQATVDLPDVAWRTDTDGDYIDVTRKLAVDDVEVRDTARVGNVLTLGTGSIELDGQSSTIEVANADYSVVIAPASVRASSPDATLMLKGDEISMQTAEENRTVFSFAQSADGKFILNVSDGATLDGTISMPGTLTVNNLNVTGTVTGITTGGGGGGTTPTIDFSNGVTIMKILTADDIVADTVAASTLSAESSLSVDSEQIIYRSSSDGAMYIQGDIVNATVVVAPTLMPTHIQGATFTGPLVVTQDNALQVLGPGGGTEIRNGNITTDTGKANTFSVMETLVVNELVATGAASITDTLVVNDLVVTGTGLGVPRLEVDAVTARSVSITDILVVHSLDVAGIVPRLNMDKGRAQNVSVTDTLVVKDLVVTGTTTGIQGGGGDTPSEFPSVIEGDFLVNGDFSTVNVLTNRVRLEGVAVFEVGNVDESSVVVALSPSRVDRLVVFAADSLCTERIVNRAAYEAGDPSNSPVDVLSPLRIQHGVTAGGSSNQLFISGEESGRAQITALTVVSTLHVGAVDAASIIVRNEITAPNLITESTLLPILGQPRTTPTGTADTLCQWAQIGSSHNMLAKGRLTYIDIPGPSEQKLPSNGHVSSFVLSLWYQVDSAGTNFQLIGSSTNAVTPVAGTTTSNRWYFSDVEIKDEHLGRNLRLLMQPTDGVPSTWAGALEKGPGTGCYIQGRYSTVSTDNDCVLAASDSGDLIHRSILTAEFSYVGDYPGLLTGEQMALLDWLAANKEALSNLISSASA